MRRKQIEAIADKIVEDLFTDGAGHHSERLVLEFDKELDGPGWCKNAVKQIVIRLSAAIMDKVKQ